MAKFFTSIQLPTAEQQDYKALQAAMGKALFKTVNSSRTAGRLEFRYDSADTIVEVINVVTKVVRAVGKNYSFTVIRDKNLRQPAKEDQSN